MTTPEALFGVVPFGRVDFGGAWKGSAGHGRARQERGEESGGAWRGLAGQCKARHERGMEYGPAGRELGMARRGMSAARNMGGHIRKNNKPTTTPWTANHYTLTH